MMSLLLVALPVVGPTASATGCDGSKLSAAQLQDVFSRPGVGGPQGYAGGDYPHAYPLPDGRVLWLFQDIFYSADDDLRDSLTAAAHNGGLVQDGSCFRTIGGPGRNVIRNAGTQPLQRWFWALDGEMGWDGALWIFVAEMRNPNGTGAGLGAVPTATYIARLDPISLAVLSVTPAPDDSASLYGFSVVSTDRYSYLYGHCYRQFVNDVDGLGQFDSGCMPKAYLARVPVGHFEAEPEYYSGTSSGPRWSSRPEDAAPILYRPAASPVSVQWFGDVFVMASKVSDWWGTTLEIDRATSPEGPWTNVKRFNIVNDRKCDNCGNYGAFLMPWLDDTGNMTVALSNGAPFELWYANAALYRPTFYSVALPGPVATGAPTAASPSGWPAVPGTSGFVAVDPVRLVDTRDAGASFGRLLPGVVATLDLRGKMPAGTEAVALNVAATGSVADGWIRVWPCVVARPETANLNPVAGFTVSNAAIVAVGDGRVCIESLAATDLVIDLAGWLTTTSDVGLVPVVPRRLADTRERLGGSSRLTAGQVLEVPVVAEASTATAVSLNVTAVAPGADGFVTVWPCGTAMPVVANLNPTAGVTRPNAVNVRVGSGGKVCVYTLRDTDLVVDLFAEFRPGAPARYGVVAPTRVLDSRVVRSLRSPADLSYVLATGEAVAAQLNVTAVGGPRSGFLTAYRCLDGVRPLVANVNHTAGEISGNAALAIAGRGYTCVFSSGDADVVADLFGVWTIRR